MSFLDKKTIRGKPVKDILLLRNINYKGTFYNKFPMSTTFMPLV